MSYDILICHSSVKEQVSQGFELDEIEHPVLPAGEVKRFLDRLKKYEYRLESESATVKEFIKTVEGCLIQVSVFATEIGFSIPYWKNSDKAIFEALQNASELSDSDSLAAFDPQAGEWLT